MFMILTEQKTKVTNLVRYWIGFVEMETQSKKKLFAEHLFSVSVVPKIDIET